MKKNMQFEWRRWTGRAGANPIVEVRCVELGENEATAALSTPAPESAKPFDWRAATEAELAGAPAEVKS